MRRLLFVILLAMATVTTQAQDFDFKEIEWSPEATTFQLFAPPTAKRVVVRIYREGIGGKPEKTVKMVPTERPDVWRAIVKGDLMGKYYTFDMGQGECPGVFAKAVGVNGQRGAIISQEQTNPEGWDNDRRIDPQGKDGLVVYEMHHRDFSIARSDAKNPGKFLALTEPWAISHLKELGVNAVHILPSYDYGSVDETRIDPDLYYEYAYKSLPKGVIPARPDFSPQYNWGYDPVNYNVPEGGYSTNPYDPSCRIREFKQMVQALHKAGIAVILDVVYNHTYDIEHSNFQRTYPDYYYRKTENLELRTERLDHSQDENTPQQGNHTSQFSPLTSQFSNGSGCGNETASEQPMMRRFMIESVKYWINEYHIDGFRFDLMGCHDIVTMNEIRKAVDAIDPNIFIYGEGWSAGACALPNEQLGMKANISKMPRIAAFSDEIRDALRGPFDDDTKGGFLAGMPNCEESLKFGIAGAISHPQVDMTKVNYSKEPWATEPTQMMSYVSCHDDMCLVDRLLASAINGNHTSQFYALSSQSKDELIRLDLLAQTAVFTSQGVPFILSGEELLRSKKGVHNSFESPDSINQLDWSNKEKYPQVFDYYKHLIALRKHHPAFRLGSADKVREHLEFLEAPEKTVAFRLKNYAGGDEWRDIIVILNANKEPAEVTIPDDSYTIVCCDGQIDENGLGNLQGTKAVADPQSALILHSNAIATTSGLVSGINHEGTMGFLGIPYAKVERFMPPLPVDKWEGIRHCDHWGPQAMQQTRGRQLSEEEMSEKNSCVLNVWTTSVNCNPKPQNPKLKPVMVWLHGGGFDSGTSAWDPGMQLAKKDVVVVSVNHRLNILGFLDLSAVSEKYSQSGNVGMLDVVQALEWVRDNIARFGGDPDNVTLFGESGGGGKVGTLMCMPAAKGLFHKAIIMSGTILNVNNHKMTQSLGKAVLKELGISETEVDRLKDVPYQQLYDAGQRAMAASIGTRKPGTPMMWGFGPTPDGKTLLQQPFQPGFANISDEIPLMIGTTFNELQRLRYGQEMTQKQAREELTKTFGDETDAYIQAFTQTYPDYTPQDLLSIDWLFRPKTIITADAVAETRKAPTYMYMFTWRSPLNNGSIHGHELKFCFNTLHRAVNDLPHPTAEDLKLADTMSSAWAQFAHTGNPNIEALPAWKPYTAKGGDMMIFNHRCLIRNNPDRALEEIINRHCFKQLEAMKARKRND